MKKTKNLLSISTLIVLILSTKLFAMKPLTPTKEMALKYNIKTVSTQEAKNLYDNGAIFADARKPVEVSMLRIKGAIRAYYSEKGGNKQRRVEWDSSRDKFYSQTLPKDKNSKIVFYCNGSHCWKSFKATVKAMELGYKNSYWYRDGLPSWKKSNYPTE